MTSMHRPVGLLAAVLMLVACADGPVLPPEAGYGPSPQLPPPSEGLLPTVNTATATGWPAGRTPIAAPGLVVTAFAQGLDHPRWVYALPNGDVLAVETNGPAKPTKGIRDFFMKQVQARAGAGVPSANRITLLRDADGDGVAEIRTVFLHGLNSPFGVVLVGSDLYVANTDGVVRFPYLPGQTSITAPGVKIADLPGGPINHRWTKTLIASRDGAKLYATVGSNSDHGVNGIENETGRAAIL
jgi:glucose/arabinose dehydrogenase